MGKSPMRAPARGVQRHSAGCRERGSEAAGELVPATASPSLGFPSCKMGLPAPHPRAMCKCRRTGVLTKVTS